MTQKLINSYLSVLCPLCNKHSNIITDQNSGELICTTCGSVIIDNAEAARSEWTSSNIQELDFRDRTGAPTSLAKYDRGLSTVIGKIDKDASGRQIDLAMKSRIGRWRTWDARSQTNDSSKRNLQSAFIQLYTLKDLLGLPESAIKKIAKISNLKEKEIARIYRKVMFELDLKIPQVDALKEIIKIGNICGISERSKRRAIKMMMTVMKTEISAGKNPMGLAGAVLYLSCKEYDEEITQNKIAEIAGVTEVTLRHDLDIISELIKTFPSKTNT